MIPFKTLSFAAIALLAASCTVKENPLDRMAPVTVHVNDFTVTQEEFPGSKAGTVSVANYSEINAITLGFYSGSEEVEKITQLKSDGSTYTTFGEFSLSLPMGSYTMVVLAYYTNENCVLTLTSPTEASFSTRSRETFAYSRAVNITSSSAVDISATLSRIISQLKVVSTDGKTADVSNVRMTFSAGGKDFNPSTGLAITNTGYSNTVGVSAAVGTHSISSSFLFLAADEQDIDVTIETLDADGNTLFSETIENVPFKRNRVTKLTGAMYTNEALSGSFKVEAGWLDDYNANF